MADRQWCPGDRVQVTLTGTIVRVEPEVPGVHAAFAVIDRDDTGRLVMRLSNLTDPPGSQRVVLTREETPQ